MRLRGIEVKSPEQVREMRRAGLVVAQALRLCRDAARPGVTTVELNAIALDVLATNQASSSFLHYGADWGITPFPAVMCISVNEEIVHGIPGDRTLADGDLVSLDFGAIVNGWHGDAAVTVLVGQAASAERRQVDDVTREALWHGLGAVRPGGRVGDIGSAVESFVRSQKHSFGIVEEYTGHGIGSQMHQPPDVPNYGRRGRGARLQPGMCLAVEPMLTYGRPDNATLADDWTVVTVDSSDAAHWEHTVAITPRGAWVLTADDGGEELLGRYGARFDPLAD